MTSKSESLAEALPKEIRRNKKLLAAFKSIGNPGIFGAVMISQDIERAEQAILEGDTVAMLRTYDTLIKNQA